MAKTSKARGNQRLLKLADILDAIPRDAKNEYGRPAYDQGTWVHPCGARKAVPLTLEDREIVRARRAGVTVLMDRQDATDMLLYGQLRKQGIPKEALSLGISFIMDGLDRDLMKEIARHVEGLRGGVEEPRPTLQ